MMNNKVDFSKKKYERMFYTYQVNVVNVYSESLPSCKLK